MTEPSEVLTAPMELPTVEPVFSRQQLSDAMKLGWLDFVTPLLMRMFRIERLNRLYQRLGHLEGMDFVEGAIEALRICYQVPPEDLEHVPREGAFVALANHPYGGIDGLSLIRVLHELRPDFRVMANYWLQRMSGLRPFMVYVNQYRDIGTRGVNTSGIRQVLKHLRGGGCLGVFPAGAVAVRERLGGPLRDQPWQPSISRLLLKSKVAVLPMYFEGGNSWLFDGLGLIDPPLRRYLLAYELFNKRGAVVRFRIGPPVSAQRLAACGSEDEVTALLRAAVCDLGPPGVS